MSKTNKYPIEIQYYHYPFLGGHLLKTYTEYLSNIFIYIILLRKYSNEWNKLHIFYNVTIKFRYLLYNNIIHSTFVYMTMFFITTKYFSLKSVISYYIKVKFLI